MRLTIFFIRACLLGFVVMLVFNLIAGQILASIGQVN